MKKIKIFLGGYINSSNSQNLNCLALAKYLDRKKFEIYTMSLYSGNLQIDENLKKEIKVFKCFKPFYLSRKFAYIWGILNSDIVYLPKGEEVGLNFLLIKFLKRKSFKTIEGIFNEKNMISAIEHHGNYKRFKKSFEGFSKLFSITSFLKGYNEKKHNIVSDEKILYLGTDISNFLDESKQINNIFNVVFIGRLLERKGIYDILELAKKFSNLFFHIVGDGPEKEKFTKIIDNQKLKNVKLYGKLNHTQLSNLLKNIDLHILPSRSEGFPKVTLETAASGIPSLVYSDYGATEWIRDHYDGFVVDTLDEMVNVIQELIDNPSPLQKCSKNAVQMAKRFDWKVVIKEWEKEILAMVKDI